MILELIIKGAKADEELAKLRVLLEGKQTRGQTQGGRRIKEKS